MRILLLFFLLPLYCLGQTNSGVAKFPFNFEVLENLSYSLSTNDTIIPLYKNGKFQYINSYTKQPYLNQLFDEAYPFHKGYGLVKKDTKYGVIDTKGNYVVKPSYYHITYLPNYSDGINFETEETFSYDNGKLSRGYGGLMDCDPVTPSIYGYKKGDKYGLVYKSGKKTAPIYDSILFIDNYSIVVRKHGKVGIIDNNQGTILPFVYDEYAGVRKYWTSGIFAMKKGKIWMYFKGRKKMFDSQFKPASLNDNLFIFEKKGLFNYFNEQGRIVLPKYYKWISANLRIAITQNDEVVIFNNKNEEFVYFTK